jgi:hypothetical protein
MKFVRFLMFPIFISLFACAGIAPITNISERISGPGYSLLPPQEEGWTILEKSHNGISMGKKGDVVDETYAAIVWIMKMPDKGVPPLVLVQIYRIQQYPSERFEPVLSTSIDAKKGCETFSTIHRDKGARKTSDNPNPMLIKDYDQYCVHPHNKALLVLTGFSHRYYQENEDPGFDRKAIEFVQNVSLDMF